MFRNVSTSKDKFCSGYILKTSSGYILNLYTCIQIVHTWVLLNSFKISLIQIVTWVIPTPSLCFCEYVTSLVSTNFDFYVLCCQVHLLGCAIDDMIGDVVLPVDRLNGAALAVSQAKGKAKINKGWLQNPVVSWTAVLPCSRRLSLFRAIETGWNGTERRLGFEVVL